MSDLLRPIDESNDRQVEAAQRLAERLGLRLGDILPNAGVTADGLISVCFKGVPHTERIVVLTEDSRYWVDSSGECEREFHVIDESDGDIVSTHETKAEAQAEADQLNEDDEEDGHREPDYGAPSAAERLELDHRAKRGLR